MAILEIDLNSEKLAEAGYNAAKLATINPMDLQSWDNLPLDMRNFWREWARQFIIAHKSETLGGGRSNGCS